MSSTSLRFASLLLLGSLACGDDDGPAVDAGAIDAGSELDAGGDGDAGMADVDAGRLPTTIGGDRPANVVLPRDYDGTPRPLVILLHGYGASGGAQDLYLGLSRTARQRGIVTVIPDGTQNAGGQRFWNATEACCLFGATPVDDVAYVNALVDEAIATYAIDDSRVYLFGHSNGGFMSHRLACETPERFAAIVTLAGTTFSDEADCASPEAISLLHVHGTLDETIGYEGGAISGFSYPGAVETAARLAARAGCAETATEGERFDFSGDTVAQETIHGSCDEGFDVRLWTLEDGSHIPAWGEGTMDRALDWLLARSR
jgi:polyhydroxybutyrate depolymerase